MKYNPDPMLKELPAIKIAGIRVKARYSDYGKFLGPLYTTFGKWAKGKPMNLIYDEVAKAEGADFEPALQLKDGAPENNTRTLPAVRALCLVHKGPYEELSKSYQKITDMIKDKNLKRLAPSREVYIKGPGKFFKGNPARYVTEIQIPIEG